MESKPDLSAEERLYLELKGLYEGFGYSPFRMRRFEEYSLYADNLNFLRSRDVITFGSRDGRLLALKPDVTLSIVKNCAGEDGLKKAYHRESVYRPGSDGQFREINQIGLECVGDADGYAELEVLSLAAESLKAIGDDCAMDVSHMGALSAMARAFGREVLPGAVLRCIRARNLHDLPAACRACGMEGAEEKLAPLFGCTGGNGEKLALLNDLFGCGGVCRELERALRALEGAGVRVQADFSLVNDAAYYNGVVFQGYVASYPRAVLSGGRYDNLVKKFGAGRGGIGFALYPDELDFYLGSKKQFDADVLVLYAPEAAPEDVLSFVCRLRGAGESVFAAASVPENLRFKRVIKF